MNRPFDVVVLGGGPAGMTAALRARELGARVAVVEQGRMGGTATNDGVAPTRVLAKAARLARDAAQFADYGLEADPPRVNFARVMARTRAVIEQIHEKKQLEAHLDAFGVMPFVGVGQAYFNDAHTVRFDSGEVSADRFIICVGGSPRRLGFPGAEHTLTLSDIWSLDAMPASLIVVGSGATGCQVASIFADFGAQVTLMEVLPRLLITEDELVADALQAAFERRRIDILTGIGGIERVDLVDGNKRLTYTYNGETQTRDAAAILLAVGWPGNAPSLNLAAAGVETKGAYIAVDDYLRTSVPHIFAAGDITGRMMLVQSAAHQARIAAENAVLGVHRRDYNLLIPHGGFTDPEYGGVGLTEAQARERFDVAVAVVPYSDLDRAVIDGRTFGFCKLIVDRATRQIVGAHVVGEQALEVVQMITAGMAGGMRIEQYADLELAYPTFAAIAGVAARQLALELNQIVTAPSWRFLRRSAEWELRSSANTSRD
jgi:pyruvate/2-oxoglutarate dehydrogenase complex dihydrolipoamide dehydrogenase (E3) component